MISWSGEPPFAIAERDHIHLDPVWVGKVFCRFNIKPFYSNQRCPAPDHCPVAEDGLELGNVQECINEPEEIILIY